MFRTAARSSLPPRARPVRATRRSFASTVLLSRSYESKTVAELRAELRQRGLQTSGPKAALISRIRQEDARATAEAPSAPTPTPTPTPSQAQPSTRTLSTSAGARAEAAPVGTTKGSPAPPFSMYAKLPDLSQASPQAPVQVPFLPDFWDSSAVKAAAAEAAAAKLRATADPDAPKLVLVASAATHPAGGPTHALSQASDVPLPSSSSTSASTPSSSASSTASEPTTLLGEVLDDLGVPADLFARTDRAEGTRRDGSQVLAQHARPLDADERRGAYALLGLLVGAWVAAGIAAPTSGGKGKKAESH
ncbi:hypothetical protein DFH11DRAFT_1542118 [Phellopilus nigrolimitatus]|nr:hypothetical protein DFH11DRAFT_1542118 [Phellopilus nigrolimitatus]